MPFFYSIILPSVEIVTICQGINLPLACKAFFVAISIPPQHLTSCSSACKFHTRVIQNLFFAISEKNKVLMQKLGYMSRRTTREKLMAYLSVQAKKQGMAEFTIPFNRQQLADFLSVDRSAMSNELCKMRDEGLIEFNKNNFKLM